MAEIKSVDVLLKIGSKVVGGQKAASLSMNASVIPTTTKASGGWETKIGGVKNWSISCESVYHTDCEAQTAILAAFENGTAVECELSNGTGYYRKGNAIITSLSEEAGENDVVAYSMSLEGTGALVTTKA